MRHRRQLLRLAALLVAAAGCRGGAAGPHAALARPDGGAPLKPITIEPAPTCDLGAEPASRPRGTLIGVYHTANVVGEVDPCG